MPGVEVYSSQVAQATPEVPSAENDWMVNGVYNNPRLDPKNYLEGELSDSATTRLRQMLARPGIVTAPGICDGISARCALEAGFTCLYQR